MSALAGLGAGLARAYAGAMQGRAQAWDENQRDDERRRALEEEAKQRAFNEWLQRRQLQLSLENREYARGRDALEDQRQREGDVRAAQQQGYQDATPEAASQGMAAAASAMGVGAGQGMAGARPRTAPFRTKVGGVTVQAEDMGGPQYATVGGRRMVYDPQRGANADARERAEQAGTRYQERLDAARQSSAYLTAMRQAQQGKQLPIAKADEMGTFNGLMRTAEEALTALDTATDAGKDPTGLIPGLAATKVGGWLGMGHDPQEQSARSVLANLTSQIMKERSGGAITPSEFDRLDPFLPSKWDDEARARQKLIDLYRELGNLRASRLDAMEASGWNVGGVRGAYTPQPNFGQRGGAPAPTGYSTGNPFLPHGGR